MTVKEIIAEVIDCFESYGDASLSGDQLDALIAHIEKLEGEIDRLSKLNDDKFRTIQAYCKAASEDKAENARLQDIVDTLRNLDPVLVESVLDAAEAAKENNDE